MFEENKETAEVLTLETVKELINKTVNAAITGKGFAKQVAKALKEADPATEADTTPTSTATSDSQAVAALKKQVATLLERDKQREETAKAMKLDAATQEQLLKVGTDSKFVNHAHRYVKQNVRYDEDGNMVYRHEDIDYPLSEGLAKWAATEDAKLYKPAKGTAGTGGKTIQSQDTKQTNNNTKVPNVGQLMLDAFKQGQI